MPLRRYERRGVVWPLILVFIGAVLLLNNLGLTEFSLWSLAIQLWPAILLAIGVDILIPRRSAWGTALAILAVATVFLGSFWLMGEVSERALEGTTIRQSDDGVRTAEIALDPAVGSMVLDGRAPDNMLIEGTASQLRREQLEPEFSVSDGRAVFQLSPQYGPGVTVVLPWPRVLWDLSVASDIPLDLRSEIGVGEMQLDLSQVQVDDLNVSFGVGRAEIDLPSGRPLRARIDGGVGEIVLRVPHGSSVRVQLPEGLTAESLPPGYIERGSSALSNQALEGDPEIVITVDLGVGSFKLVESGG